MQTSLTEAAVQPAESTSAVRRARPSYKLIFATSLGNGLEVFDFTVFSFFASYIGSAFFPTRDPLVSLMFAVGTFAAGFFARPLGAMLIGSFADRVGRRAAMTVSIWLMAIGTAAIGLCPTYAMLGVAAPLIVLTGRLIQGFAAGGEIGAATTYLMESDTHKRRGFMVSWQCVSQGAAAILGALCGLLLTHAMSAQSLASWGWRIPFVLGLLVAPVGYYIRRHLPESHESGTGKANSQQATMASTANAPAQASPIRTLMTQYPLQLGAGILLILSQTVTLYVVVYFMPSYLTRVMHYPTSIGFEAAITSAFSFAVASFLGGLLADRFKRRKPLLLTTMSLSLILCVPAFWLLVHVPSVLVVLAVCAVMTALMGLGVIACMVLMMEMFPASVRASGYAVGYATSATLFGGTAQFVTTSLIVKTGSPMAAGYYVLACLVITWFTLLLLREKEAE